MAMLRLLTRDSGALAVLPPLVVKDEISQGLLSEYQTLTGVEEYFYAISVPRKQQSDLIRQLLRGEL